MQRGKIQLDNPHKFSGEYKISPEKIEKAIQQATYKLKSKLSVYKDKFPENIPPDGNDAKYYPGENNSWVSGMHTGVLILAYLLTKNECFLDAAKNHIPSYRKRIKERFNMQDHDVGFVISPSIVALYKITGDEALRELALEAANYFYEYSYSQEGGFIILDRHNMLQGNPHLYRTIMDTLMNIPLFFWAWEESGNEKFLKAAQSQVEITEKYLIREDGSSFHHYMFDIDTHKPSRGLTFQGNRDESTWSRGHSWGILGLMYAYEYMNDASLLDLERDIVYYMLNHLPDDNIPYWDYDFSDGSNEPRDTSAGVIAACGMMEACKFLEDTAPEKQIYKNASAMLLEAVIDKYTGDAPKEYDGLIWGVTGAKKFDIGIEDCAVYADYFYLESLIRYKNPEWERVW